MRVDGVTSMRVDGVTSVRVDGVTSVRVDAWTHGGAEVRVRWRREGGSVGEHLVHCLGRPMLTLLALDIERRREGMEGDC